MVSLVDSEAVFREHAGTVGLPDDSIERLINRGIDTMAKIAYSVGQPGDTPSQADLEGLIDGGDRNCTIGEISALRRLVFESQTLMIAQIKATVEGKSDEGATELAPAEREDRMKRQAERLRGLSLEGELECGYAGYDTVMKMLQDNAVTYLHPNRFPSRRFELLNEKKKQEILVTNNQSLAVKSNAQVPHCDTSSELLLLQALTRRALCLDLVGAASFDVVEKYHSMLMRCLQETSPPGYRQVDVEQILKADQRAWLRLSEMVKSGLKRGTDGQLPLDSAFPRLETDPQVCFQLLPLPSGAAPKRERPAEPPSESRPSKKSGGVIKGKGKTKGKHKQPKNMPEALRGKRHVTGKGKRICWDYNLPHGCSHTDVKDGGECPKGVHICMEWNCGRNHPLHKHE